MLTATSFGKSFSRVPSCVDVKLVFSTKDYALKKTKQKTHPSTRQREQIARQ